MSRSPLTLAAHATNAVAGLDITSVAPFSRGGSGDYDSVLLTAADGALFLFRTPTSPEAEGRQQTELRSLGAFSPGIRTRVPFGIPHCVGHTEVGATIGMLYEFVPGEPIDKREVRNSESLAQSIGRSIGALHRLPTSFVDDYALPHEMAGAAIDDVTAIIDRANATKRVPEVVSRRWEQALSAPFWEFDSTVVHGDLSVASFLVSGDEVTGIIGWERLRVGDPAQDLAWFIDMPNTANQIFETYTAARGLPTDDPALRSRAILYRELGLARWLLHGVDSGDVSIIDDGTSMLAALASDIESGALGPIVPVDTFDAEAERSSRDEQTVDDDATTDEAAEDTADEKAPLEGETSDSAETEAAEEHDDSTAPPTEPITIVRSSD